ncbi:hypothetical protein DFH06DRAFT_1224659 [Mycena polygramma]|nr:hypothetical protein DFH06DRAFT_1224659 [Mycena polygramma]
MPAHTLNGPDYTELKNTINGYIRDLGNSAFEPDSRLRDKTIDKLNDFIADFHEADGVFKNWFYGWMNNRVAAAANRDLENIWRDYNRASKLAAQERAQAARGRDRRPRTQPMTVPGNARSGPPPPSPPAAVLFPHVGNAHPGPAPASYGMAASMDVNGHYANAAGTPSSRRSRRYSALPMGGPWNHAQAPPAPQPTPSIIAFQQGVAFHPYMPQNGSPPESVQSYPARLPTDQYAYEQAQQQPMGYHNTYTGYPDLNQGPYYPNGSSPYSG